MRKVLLGQKFDRLTVLAQIEKRTNYLRFLCKCDCGNTVEVDSTNLLNGGVGSCGCLRHKKIETVELDNGCVICSSHSKDRHGYPVIARNGKRYIMSRYVYEQKYGEIPSGLLVCHKCDNPACINPDHLFLGTYKDNYQDSKSKNRNSKGEKHGNSKLSASDVRFIRENCNNKMNVAELSKKFNVSKTTILKVVSKKTYRDIQ